MAYKELHHKYTEYIWNTIDFHAINNINEQVYSIFVSYKCENCGKAARSNISVTEHVIIS